MEVTKNKCTFCQKTFQRRANVYRHIRDVHNVEVTGKKTIKCPNDQCSATFFRKQKLREHVNEIHGIPLDVEVHRFATFDDFLLWKIDMEKKINCFYITNQSAKAYALKKKIYYYDCHRTGYFTPSLTSKRKCPGSKKINACCPSAMDVIVRLKTNKVKVIFWKSHYGHDNEVKHVSIKQKAKSGTATVRNRKTENPRQNAEKVSGNFAFDNPYFKDQQENDETDGNEKGKLRSSINNKNSLRSSKQLDTVTKGKKSRGNKSHHFIFGGGGGGKKQRALDDSCLAVEPERTVISLRGHDFTGLGFNICGNMRDGILVKDVLHRGPASESGRIKAGDRIISVTVSFTNIVYEDALTILSYASPYDVQLELERIPDKTRAMQTSPAGSKRLGSCSFSSGGQKLFHPLYRSQSIDDLTQIDKDTFPSHSFGPRRSQSIGVAAHKLAAHFKHSDTRLEEKDRTAASVILSTTGSLNEKMLANVIADGASKSGLQWEKRFEDTLESEPSETSTSSSTKNSKKVNISSDNKSATDHTYCISNLNNGKTDISDKTHSHSKHNSREKKESESNSKSRKENNSAEIKTNVQVHRFEDLSNKRAKTMAEASSALWQLDQSIKDGESGNSDLDTSNSYPWNNASKVQTSFRDKASVSAVSPEINSKERTRIKSEKVTRIEAEDEDTDVSGDSLELNSKKKQCKKNKHRFSSVSDLTQIEDSTEKSYSESENKRVKNSNKSTSNNISLHPRASTRNEENDGNRLRNSIKGNSTIGSWHNGERKCDNGTVSSTKQNGLMGSTNSESSHLNKSPHSVYANSSVIHISNKEQQLERSIMNRVNSPKLSVKSPSYVEYNSAYQKSDLQSSNMYVNSSNLQEKSHPSRSNQKIRAEPIKGINVNNLYASKENSSSRNFIPSHGSNNNNVYNCDTESNCEWTSSQQSKQAYNSRNSNKQGYRKNACEEQDLRVQELKHDTTAYPQFPRKSANPAGMFTQINPFHQPCRQKSNMAPKSWTPKDELKKELTVPVNGNSVHYSSAYPKTVQVTTCDSSGLHRSRRETMLESQVYNHRTSENIPSKTVLISSYSSGSHSPALNSKQIHR